MSIWCEVSGWAKGDKLSIRKAIKYIFADDDYVIDKGLSELPEFSFRFEDDGICATNKVERFIDYIETYNAKYDITVVTRWVS